MSLKLRHCVIPGLKIETRGTHYFAGVEVELAGDELAGFGLAAAGLGVGAFGLAGFGIGAAGVGGLASSPVLWRNAVTCAA